MQKKKEAILRSQIDNFQKILHKTREEINQGKQKEVDDQGLMGDAPQDEHNVKYDKEMFKHGGDDSLVDQQNITPEQFIGLVKSEITKTQNEKRVLKHYYIKELQNISQLEFLIRTCIEDIKDQIAEVKSGLRLMHLDNPAELDRNLLLNEELKELFEREKLLTLIYDKAFHVQQK